MKRSMLLTVLFFLGIPSFVFGQELALDLYEKGKNSYNRFSDTAIEEAVAFFEETINISPSFSSAHAALAEGYIQQYLRTGSNNKKLLKKAFEIAEKSLFLDAKSPLAHKTLGTVYFASGKPEEAVEEFERAVDMEPAYARAWLNLGSSYYELGDSKTAASHFTRATELKNDSLAEGLAHYNLAALLYEEGNYSKALNSYEKAKTILHEYHNIYYGIGVTLMQLGRDKEAVKLFKKAIGMKAGDADFHVGLASAYHRLGEKGKAKISYERALDIDPDRKDARQGLMGLEGMKMGPVDIY